MLCFELKGIYMQKIWKFAAVNRQKQQELANAAGISELVAGILLQRGIEEKEAAERFLQVEKQPFYDPFLLKDMDRAVARIQDAILQQQTIVIYGDYDVDGITSAVLLMRTLQALGAKASYYIPDRQTEGYGLHAEALEKLSVEHQLLISVDCGISAVETVAACPDSLDIIITDHHLPGEYLPKAIAVVDPHRTDCSYPDKKLAGVGVAFKLCQALWQKMKGIVFEEDLEIVALGTIADIVPLTGENRRLVKNGLKRMETTDILGLRALINVCNLDGQRLEAGHVGFLIAPRLNAAGRLLSACKGVDLLLSTDAVLAKNLATELNDENEERQRIEKEMVAQAGQMIIDHGWMEEPVIVLADDRWHAGVIGIVASRILEKYYRPVIIISLKDGQGKGSCRSISGFHMQKALTACQDLLISYGGHAQAAGLSIQPENIAAFRDKISQLAAATLSPEDYFPVVQIEKELQMQELDKSFVEQLSCLEPYGMGNPRPVFSCTGTRVASSRQIGKEGLHLRVELEQAGNKRTALAWNQGERAASLLGTSVDAAFQPEINYWRDQVSVQMKLLDLRANEQQTTDLQELWDRRQMGKLYLLLKKRCNENACFLETMEDTLKVCQQICDILVDKKSFCTAIQVFEELGLLSIKQADLFVELLFHPLPPQKLELMQSATYAKYLLK